MTISRTALQTFFFAISITACDNQQVDVESTESEQLDEIIPQLRASSSDQLNTCKWHVTTYDNLEPETVVACSANQKPISGGCWQHAFNQSKLEASYPFEDYVSLSNVGLMEWLESWYATDGTTGWKCVWDHGTPQVEPTIKVYALCCGT